MYTHKVRSDRALIYCLFIMFKIFTVFVCEIGQILLKYYTQSTNYLCNTFMHQPDESKIIIWKLNGNSHNVEAHTGLLVKPEAHL